jgi:hypothetical protein
MSSQPRRAHGGGGTASSQGGGGGAGGNSTGSAASGRRKKRRKVCPEECPKKEACAALRAAGFSHEAAADDLEQRANAWVAGLATKTIPKRLRPNTQRGESDGAFLRRSAALALVKKLQESLREESLRGINGPLDRLKAVYPEALRAHAASGINTENSPPPFTHTIPPAASSGGSASAAAAAAAAAAASTPELPSPVVYADVLPMLRSLAAACQVAQPAFVLADKTIAPPATLAHHLDHRQKKTFQMRPNSGGNLLNPLTHPDNYCTTTIAAVQDLLEYVLLTIGFKKTNKNKTTPSPEAYLATAEAARARSILAHFVPAVDSVSSKMEMEREPSAAEWWAHRLGQEINNGIKSLAIGKEIPKKEGRGPILLTDAETKRAVIIIKGKIRAFFGVSAPAPEPVSSKATPVPASGECAAALADSVSALDNSAATSAGSIPLDLDPNEDFWIQPSAGVSGRTPSLTGSRYGPASPPPRQAVVFDNLPPYPIRY